MEPLKSLQVITLGCSKNTVDTEHLLAQLEGKFEIRDEEDDRPVDYLLVNTCGFIGDAKQQSIDEILSCVERKKRGGAGKLFVFGCLSQRYLDKLPGLIPEVDGWYGARDLAPVVKALGVRMDPALRNRRTASENHRSYAYLKISEGCDRRCSYCAIPFIRGAHRSVPMEDIIDEARSLAAEGVRELILIAQDTTYYGLDLYGKRCLAELLRKLSDIEGFGWIRVHYSYPADFPEDVLDEMAGNPKVCRYLDIPLQHVSDNVLKAMHRGVDGKWTRELIGKMREKVPGIVLRTTMIVGHPGETAKDFRELLDFVREARFERLGAFKYSEEEGTFDALNFKDSVSPSVKQSRYEKLMDLQRGISLEYNESRVGTETTVLVDDYADGALICRSEFESPEVDGEIIVRKWPEGIDPETLVGGFAEVRITAAGDYDLEAELIGRH
jgi:ribosomal protein S12 methylthiotransferase